ncbi:MAG: MBL fold metallo-hydrolase [Burkholderiaceae bacterium]|nr:MBL fold metallo-hydrolase [Burkholderiaceae bacterium]
MPSATDPALHGLTILERGWLSSNDVLLHGQDSGAWLVDSSHVLHGAQTVALLRQTLRGAPLRGIVNTHLHSDHCGGNAAVQRAFGCTITVPPGQWAAVQAWDEDALSYRLTGQRCERFVADACLQPGQTLEVGGRRWWALAAPGHDPHSIVLFDDREGVLISADALWENGFGIVFPELEGEAAFDDVAQTLELIDTLDARWVIPGHGAPFTDAAGALQRARRRLDGFRADPARHSRHAIKVLIKYHLLEEQQQPWSDFLAWFTEVEMCRAIWDALGHPKGTMPAFAEHLVAELVASGALGRRDALLLNA